MEKVQKILSFAMRMEKDAADFYSYYLDKVKTPATKELFNELVETEKQHYGFLKSKYDELGFSEPPLVISWVVDSNFAAKDPHILANNSEVAGGSDAEISDLSIIRMAYLIESDFAEFYKNAVEVVEDEESKKMLKTLADWEEQHKKLFQEKYQKLIKKYWSDISSIVFPE